VKNQPNKKNNPGQANHEAGDGYCDSAMAFEGFGAILVWHTNRLS
jgi:hypothetical protein